MSTLRSRTALGRSSINADQTLPPSPRALINTPPTLSQVVGRQTPRSRQIPPTEAVIPEIANNDLAVSQEQNLPKLVQSKSLDEELVRSGYTPLSKIVVVESNNGTQVPLVKAQNDIGEPVYIAVDTNDTYIAQSPNDPRFKTSKSLVSIPKAEKEMAFSQAGLGVAGVAMECNDGLCTIMHDTQAKAPREMNYGLIAGKKNNDNVVASYPIVKLSELRMNASSVQKNVECALRKMRNASLKACLCDVEKVQKKFDCLCGLFRDVSDLRSKVIKEFHHSMTVLENAHDNYAKCPAKNAEKIKQIAFNIEKRNAKFPHLIESCKEVANLDKTIDDINKALEETKCALQKKFKHLHCAYEHKDKSKHCGCAWDKHDHDEEDDHEHHD